MKVSLLWISGTGMVEPYSKMEVTMWGTGRMIRSADGAQLIDLIRKLGCMYKKREFGTIMAN
jgi:hypothetical protein